ncbi:hypothetical protein KPH14_012572 [Odynerus spinipes]|uniref:Uncharacterized protein n=1 Tax=Odynerus spinipes TaxID=1348599 RepID=A0AAD9RFX1_9HYME|nr:hypothetical protein KPH14_012572 [Odynerus spinipes]
MAGRKEKLDRELKKEHHWEELIQAVGGRYRYRPQLVRCEVGLAKRLSGVGESLSEGKSEKLRLWIRACVDREGQSLDVEMTGLSTKGFYI